MSRAQGSQFRTVRARMAGIYRSGTYIGTRTLVFRDDSNINHIGLVSVVPGCIPDFGRKMKVG